jgi:beta-lactamase class A
LKLITAIVLLTLLPASVALAQTPAPASTPSAAAGDKPELLWQKLESTVRATDSGLDGVLGVAVLDLTDGHAFLYHADEIFPTASTIKLALLAELYRQNQQGESGAAKKARLSDLYTVRREDLVPDSSIMGGLTPGVTRVTNRDLATMVVAVSDNSATNVLIQRVGMESVNAMLDELGLHKTRLRRQMMDLAAAKAGRENVATPRELAELLQAIYSGKLLGKPMTDDLLLLLSTTKNSPMRRALPEDVRVADKPGELEGVRNDCGIIYATNRPFVLCAMTTYLHREADGEAAIARITLATWEMFERLGRASDYGRVISPGNSSAPK